MTLLIDIRGGMSLDGKFPALRVGEAYYGRVTASGGTPFYTYAIVKGVLPAGLTLDVVTGEVTGTPTTDQMSAITVRATDLQGMWVERIFVIPGTRILPNHSYWGGWRYKLIPYASPFPAGIPNESTIDFDDSSWRDGSGPFGNIENNNGVGARAHAHNTKLPSQIETSVPLNQGVWLRRWIYLDAVPAAGLPVVAYVDNYLRIYANGAVGYSVNNYYDGPGDGTIPAAVLVPGANLIAAWCMDDSSTGSNDGSYFGFYIEGVSS